MPDLHSLEDFLGILDSLTIRKSNESVSPHKYVLLITLCKIIERDASKSNQFEFNEEIINNFEGIWKSYFPDSTGQVEYPFYHLASSSLWFHRVKKDKNSEYNSYKRFTPKRIKETIEYAYLHPKLFELLKEKTNRRRVVTKLEDIIEEIASGYKPHAGEKTEYELKDKMSKFPHEQQALDQIQAELGYHVELISNYDLHDPQTNQYLECDLILIGKHGLAIVELKHWAGDINITPGQWFVNGRYREDPHRHNNYKCKVLKGYCTKTFPFFTPSIYIESIVVLTNPDASIHNASKKDTDKNNPTFADIATFSKYIKRAIGSAEKKLSKSQGSAIADKLRKISEGPKRKHLYVPGYKQLVNLTESPQRIEILAQPIGNKLDTIKRLRIFSVDVKLSAEEREKQRIKAVNSLKALTHISDHLNILKVWDIFHEDGLVIEASDWSKEEGTLADVIKNNPNIDRKRALKIIKGIAEGLKVVHDEQIIHRDLQPYNIMMFGDNPKLMNFDLSYLPEDNRLTVLPEDIELPESPYLAPELYLRKAFDEATDLFSLGVIAFTLLCGKPPFEKTSLEIIHMGGKLDEMTKNCLDNAGTPSILKDLLDGLIRHDRDDRLRLAADVLEILDDLSTETKYAEELPEPNQILKPDCYFSRYRIESLIDIGREAQVYKAFKGEENQLALKLFHQEIMPQRVEKIEKIIKLLDSPYVIKCETSNQWDDGRSFLHLEWIDGQSLRQHIKGNQRPDIETFSLVTRCLLDAVKKMHHHSEGSILHNDIKPDNILIRDYGTPVLIDFGIAGPPGIGAYKGTDPYVAPDLFQEADYEFCQNSDLFSLGVTLFEWFCGASPYSGTPNVKDKPTSPTIYRDDMPVALSKWLMKAVLPLSVERFQNISEMTLAFEAIFEDKNAIIENEEPEVTLPPFTAEEKKSAKYPESDNGNSFVAYLNTFHNTTAANDGALAETQALSPFFSDIHVQSPLAGIIHNHMTKEDGGHVILTGHAGDGKSTIALEVYKALNNIDISETLESYKDHEVIEAGDRKFHIVKDMSEVTKKQRDNYIQKAVDKNNCNERWLIVSNTGTLLKTFKDITSGPAQKLSIEDDILKKLQHNKPAVLFAFETKFLIINLSQMDNVPTAIGFLQKLIASNHWNRCENCEIREDCPIWINLEGLNALDQGAVKRIGLIYRMLYEYGKRLTLRQISAHLAYSLTAGLDCLEIMRNIEFGDNQPSKFLFYNKFFGFQGTTPAKEAGRLKAIQAIRPYEMGAKPFPQLDQTLWLKESGSPPDIPDSLNDIVEELKSSSETGSSAYSSRLRQELRRLYFVFGNFHKNADEKRYISEFCNSPLLYEYELWQQNPQALNHSRQNDLRNRALRVLREQFVGFYLPDKIDKQYLFITLNRRNPALRQSVQLLLARIPFHNFKFELQKDSNEDGLQERCMPVLKESLQGFLLKMELPFLDYVMLRSSGEIGQQLDKAYLDRLERFKARLLNYYQAMESTGNKTSLLEFTSDGSFNIWELAIDDEILNVEHG